MTALGKRKDEGAGRTRLSSAPPRQRWSERGGDRASEARSRPRPNPGGRSWRARARSDRPPDGGRGGGDRGSEVAACFRHPQDRGAGHARRSAGEADGAVGGAWRWFRRGKSRMSLASGPGSCRPGETRSRRSCRSKPQAPHRRRRRRAPTRAPSPLHLSLLRNRPSYGARGAPRPPSRRPRPSRPSRTGNRRGRFAPAARARSRPSRPRSPVRPSQGAQEPGLGEAAKIESRLADLEAAIKERVERAGDARRYRQGRDPDVRSGRAARGDRDASHRSGEGSAG